MSEILERIAKKERISVTKKALQIIAKKGDRIPRDCINLLQDVAESYDGNVTAENVLERCGEADSKLYFGFICAAHGGLQDILSFIAELSRFVLEALYVRLGISSEDFDANYIKMLKKLFEKYRADEFHKLLRLIDEATKRTTAEICSAELALSVLALNIGDITAIHEDIAAENLKIKASNENSDGAKKYLEREENLIKPVKKEVELGDFLSKLGAVNLE